MDDQRRFAAIVKGNLDFAKFLSKKELSGMTLLCEIGYDIR